jgi:lysyl-tRNA synthetase class 1
LLLISAGDIEQALSAFPGSEQADAESWHRMRRRARCAWNWIQNFAPEDFRFTLRTGEEQPEAVSEAARAALHDVRRVVEGGIAEQDEKQLEQALYDTAQKHGFASKEFFALMYRVLIGRDKGPRLAGFLKTIGRERVLRILSNY